MRFHFTCAAGLMFVLFMSPLRATDWLLTAVPQATGKDSQVLNISKPFQVVLTNATNHNLVVWKEWCSWGYFNLSFEFADKCERIFKIQKAPEMSWTRNGPASFVVKPGCAYTITVKFRDLNPAGRHEWSGVENLRGEMSMKAIYKNTNEAFPGEKPNPQNKVPDDMQKRIDSAWVGQVESTPISVNVVR